MPGLPVKSGADCTIGWRRCVTALSNLKGIELTYVTIGLPFQVVGRMVKDQELDVAETFLALYMSLPSQG